MEANSPKIESEQKLWNLNSITYSVAVAWRYIKSEIKENTEVTRSKDQLVKCGKENCRNKTTII